MKILLIRPKETDSMVQREAYPAGALLLLGTMLQNKGHEVKITHMAAGKLELPELKNILVSFKPEIVGITMNTFQTRSAREVSDLVKETSKTALVVTGGPHPSALKTEIFGHFPNIDVVVVGEGEHTFMEIAEGKDLKDIKGICYAGRENPARGFSADLDHIPLPNLDLVDINDFSGSDPVGGYPSMFIMASRGCPYQCCFCNKSIWGSKVRFRKPELIVQEIEWLHNKYGIREIFFQDDTFNMKREWAEKIFNLIIEKKLNKNIVYKTPFRANEKLVDEKLLRLAKAAGFWLIFYGVENGNQKMLDSMGKGLTIEEIKRAFKLTHEAGIETIGSFIIGMPGETEETVNDSIKLWEEITPYVTGCVTAIPFPNTEFDKIVTKAGHKLISDYSQFSVNKIIVRTEALDEHKIRSLHTKFRKMILRRFFLDVLKLRYLRLMLVALKSPRYGYEVLYKVRAYFKRLRPSD